MSYQPKEGSGALFKNDKGDNPARPDYRGDIMLGGKLHEVSGWIKPLPNNPEQRFMSLSGKPKEARRSETPQRPATRGQRGSGFDDMTDDQPF